MSGARAAPARVKQEPVMTLRIGAIVQALGGELSGDAERVITRLDPKIRQCIYNFDSTVR